MKLATWFLALALGATAPAQAQAFVNLGFEDIGFTPPDTPTPLLLTWDEAAPGWSHSPGESADVVNYLAGHLGFGQNYVLLDPTAAPPGAISGSFALGMHGGSSTEQSGDFVQAFIEQSGLVPAGTTTLHMLANNRPFEVMLDGVRIDMRPVGLDPASPTYFEELLLYSGDWAGDVSSFAGQVVDLKILDSDAPPGQPELLVVDDIRFLPVPEPSSAALMLAGILLCVFALRGSPSMRKLSAFALVLAASASTALLQPAVAMTATATLSNLTFTVTSLDGGPAWFTIGTGPDDPGGSTWAQTMAVWNGVDSSFDTQSVPGILAPLSLSSTVTGAAAQAEATFNSVSANAVVEGVAGYASGNTVVATSGGTIHFSPNSTLVISADASSFAEVSEVCASTLGCGEARAYVQLFGSSSTTGGQNAAFTSYALTHKDDFDAQSDTLTLSFTNQDVESNIYLLVSVLAWTQNLGPDHVLAVPEPGTYALMLGGLALIGWGARRSRRPERV